MAQWFGASSCTTKGGQVSPSRHDRRPSSALLSHTERLCFSDWAAAIRVAALDCAEKSNHEVCQAYDIYFYPTFRVSALLPRGSEGPSLRAGFTIGSPSTSSKGGASVDVVGVSAGRGPLFGPPLGLGTLLWGLRGEGELVGTAARIWSGASALPHPCGAQVS